MSRRERLIALLAGLAILVLGVDRWVLSPLLERRQTLEDETAELAQELQQAQAILRARRDGLPRWRELVGHHIPRDISDAEGQLLAEVRTWARDASLTVRSIQPDRPQSKGEFREVALTLNGVGSMAAITEFLYRLQFAQMPMHVERVRIAQGDDSTLTLDVRLSTLYRSAAGANLQSPVTQRPVQGQTALARSDAAAGGNP